MVNKVINLQEEIHTEARDIEKNLESTEGISFHNYSFFTIKRQILNSLYYSNYKILLNSSLAIEKSTLLL